MIKHFNRLSPSFQKKLAFTGVPFSNPTSIALPGITNETQKVTLELLEKNHQNFDIFYNDNLFHNHFVHHILAAYSMGASVDNLKDVYDKNYVKYQRPKPPSKIRITHENWKEHLGQPDLWADYLKFFDNAVKEDGMEKAFNTYAFNPTLLPYVFAGAFHSIIHLGHALESQIPLVLSEGLAEAAVHPNEFEKVLDEKFFSSERSQKKSIMEIIKSTHKENRFDVLSHGVQLKRQKLLAERADLVREFAKDWDIIETEEGIREATRELYEACVTLYGSTAIRPGYDAIHLDFFLMHGLTSVLMIVEMLPYLSLDQQRKMLKGHFAALLAEYVAQGRPKLNIDALNNYSPKTTSDSPNPWLEVIQTSLLIEDCHVMKVIRSLLRAEQLWPQIGKDNIYLKLAQITCQSYRANGWARGVGYKEQWIDSQTQRVRMEWRALGY